MAKIKYDEGYIDLRQLGFGVIPKPHQLWSNANRALILPSILSFAVGWSFEITSHLEELAFWLFLLHQVRMVPSSFSPFGRKETRVLLTTFHPGTKPAAPLVLKLGIPRLGPRFNNCYHGSPDPDRPPSQRCRPTRSLALLRRVDRISFGDALVPSRSLEIPGILASRPHRRC